jgi:hypothetical protein
MTEPERATGHSRRKATTDEEEEGARGEEVEEEKSCCRGAAAGAAAEKAEVAWRLKTGCCWTTVASSPAKLRLRLERASY